MSVLPAKADLEQATGGTSGGQGQLPSEKPQSHHQTTHDVRYRMYLFVSSRDATSSSIHWAVKRQAPWPSWQHQQSDFQFDPTLLIRFARKPWNMTLDSRSPTSRLQRALFCVSTLPCFGCLFNQRPGHAKAFRLRPRHLIVTATAGQWWVCGYSSWKKCHNSNRQIWQRGSHMFVENMIGGVCHWTVIAIIFKARCIPLWCTLDCCGTVCVSWDSNTLKGSLSKRQIDQTLNLECPNVQFGNTIFLQNNCASICRRKIEKGW